MKPDEEDISFVKEIKNSVNTEAELKIAIYDYINEKYGRYDYELIYSLLSIIGEEN